MPTKTEAPPARSADSASEAAVDTARWCRRREPDRADCHYWLALAVGIQAHALRATAGASQAPDVFLGVGDPLLRGHPDLVAEAAEGGWEVTEQPVQVAMLVRGGLADVRAVYRRIDP